MTLAQQAINNAFIEETHQLFLTLYRDGFAQADLEKKPGDAALTDKQNEFAKRLEQLVTCYQYARKVIEATDPQSPIV